MYKYSDEKQWLFTDEGQRLLLKVRDHVSGLLASAGAVRLQEAMTAAVGCSWRAMACIDRLVELGELRELPTNSMGQHRVFVRA